MQNPHLIEADHENNLEIPQPGYLPTRISTLLGLQRAIDYLGHKTVTEFLISMPEVIPSWIDGVMLQPKLADQIRGILNSEGVVERIKEHLQPFPEMEIRERPIRSLPEEGSSFRDLKNLYADTVGGSLKYDGWEAGFGPLSLSTWMPIRDLAPLLDEVDAMDEGMSPISSEVPELGIVELKLELSNRLYVDVDRRSLVGAFPFERPDGSKLQTLDSLSEAINLIDPGEFNSYVTQDKNEFAEWVEKAFGLPELAQQLRERPTPLRMMVSLEKWMQNG